MVSPTPLPCWGLTTSSLSALTGGGGDVRPGCHLPTLLHAGSEPHGVRGDPRTSQARPHAACTLAPREGAAGRAWPLACQRQRKERTERPDASVCSQGRRASLASWRVFFCLTRCQVEETQEEPPASRLPGQQGNIEALSSIGGGGGAGRTSQQCPSRSLGLGLSTGGGRRAPGVEA